MIRIGSAHRGSESIKFFFGVARDAFAYRHEFGYSKLFEEADPRLPRQTTLRRNLHSFSVNRTVQNDTYRDLQPTAQRIQAYVEKSNSAPGPTAATQAGNEELATLVAQLQSLQAQEISDARGDVERDAQDQAEQAYAEQQRQAVRGDWTNPQQPSTSLVDAFPTANE